jgi:hypothetical protein
MKTAGIFVIILGIILTVFTTFKFFTHEKVVDLGNLEISRDKPNTLNWSPILGIAILGAGVILYYMGVQKKSS